MHLEPINREVSQSILTVILKPSTPTHPTGKPDLVIQEMNSNFLSLLDVQFVQVQNLSIKKFIPTFPTENVLADLQHNSKSYSIVSMIQIQLTYFKMFSFQLVNNEILNILEPQKSDLPETKIDFEKMLMHFEIPIGLFYIDNNGNFLFTNKKFCKIIGYNQKELIRKSLRDVGLIELADFITANKNRQEVYNLEKKVIFKRRDNSVATLVLKSVVNIGGFFICYIKNVTRKKVKVSIEQAFFNFIELSSKLNSRELMQKFLDETESLTKSKIGFFHFVNEEQTELKLQTWSSNTLNRMCKANGENLHYPLSQAGVWADCVRTRSLIIHNDYESLTNKKGLPPGHAKILRELVVPIIRNKKIVAICGVGNKETNYTKNDVKTVTKLATFAWETIQSKLNEEKMENAVKQYSNFTQLSRIAIVKFEFSKPLSLKLSFQDQRDWILNYLILSECNEIFLELYNFSAEAEVLHKKLPDIFDKETLDTFITIYLSKNYRWQNLEIVETLKSGKILCTLSNLTSIIENGLIRSIWISKNDITEKKRIEKEIQHFQRMESVGIIAGGLAHDFNNILANIKGNLELIKLDKSNYDLQQRSLDNIDFAVNRGKDITNQLLNFSRKGDQHIIIESISTIIESSVKLALSGSKCNYIIDIEDNIPNVKVDVGQMHQVLMNLLINADQEMPNGGNITIKANQISVQESVALKEGSYICISIEDEGRGIPAEIQDKIFSPFVTTKGANGLGLGMATCYSLVKKNNGHIDFQTQIGKGSMFRIYLPASQEVSSKKELKIFQQISKKGRILLMDDDESILIILKNFLEQLDQTVVISKNSHETVNFYKDSIKQGNKYDIIFLDLITPGDLGGAQVMNEILKIDPEAKGVLCTGSLNQKEFLEYWEYGFSQNLAKPFSFDEVRNLLIELLPNSLY